MKHISILIPKGHVSVVNIAGTHQMLTWVNEFRKETGRDPLFQIQLVGLDMEADKNGGLFATRPEISIQNVKKTDLIIIPAIHDDFETVVKRNKDFMPWIVGHYKEGAEIVSLCVSSFFLAATGLLDGKPCSTHWQFANVFKEHFPKAILTDERIVTDSDGIYTSGGAYAFTNLVIYLIEKYADRETAVMAAKGFMIDIERGSQSPFMVFSGQKNHKDDMVLKAQEYIEQNYKDKISVNDLCENMALSRRTFERRFKSATSNTVLEYLQRVKIEAAKKELEKGRKTVNEVMYEVGYNDAKAFRDVFRKITSMSPRQYQVKYMPAI
ncbi:GlxA family transcriptional regulator [Flagellimonas meridianipacifica]|uniref:Transcriptional regulator GlxA family with amidase domain n=1 Tax=Flagellimonas meridianipacifica TaxID=1080225 RepID=A0A2T0M9P4_9FLAO|nr:helix-turn-helix domain-containing protein [Allomuricauda pacifica]PRX54257.1 transcriptional regulator GlxA family with amidase domain [Allomuricauda pacifica]